MATKATDRPTDKATQGKAGPRPGGGGGGAAPPIMVNVYAADANGVVIFGHRWGVGTGSPAGKGPIQVQPLTQPTIHFNLIDTTGLHLAFEDPANDAIWCDLQACPEAAGNAGGQITYGNRTPHTLEVVDNNLGQACVVHFMLRFTGRKSADGPPYEYDPEFRNGGGN